MYTVYNMHKKTIDVVVVISVFIIFLLLETIVF